MKDRLKLAATLFERRRPRGLAFAVFWYVFLGSAAIVIIMPFVWMVSTSLKSTREIFTYPPTWIPREWRFLNYVDAWRAAPFGRYFFNNSLILHPSSLLQNKSKLYRPLVNRIDECLLYIHNILDC